MGRTLLPIFAGAALLAGQEQVWQIASATPPVASTPRASGIVQPARSNNQFHDCGVIKQSCRSHMQAIQSMSACAVCADDHSTGLPCMELCSRYWKKHCVMAADIPWCAVSCSNIFIYFVYICPTGRLAGIDVWLTVRSACHTMY